MIRVSIVLFYHFTKAIAEGAMRLSLPRVLASMAHCNKIKGLRCRAATDIGFLYPVVLVVNTVGYPLDN